LQVVGGGGLVVSPIQLLTSSQGFKVIGQQPNGVTTIELSTPHSEFLSLCRFQKRILIKCLLLVNGHPTGGLQHRSHHLQSHSQPGNLQKLLMNGNGVTSSTSANISTISIPAISQHGINGSRLAPGGAELNLLPSSTTPNGAIYRNQGKLAIVKGESINHFQEQVNNRCFLHNSAEMNNSNRVHVMQSTPTIVVSQPQNINIITSSPQLTGKVCFS
jgi:hypothetical protein